MNTDKIKEQSRINELVRQTQLGDQTAFANLYDEFAQRIYSFIRLKVTGNPEQAEDILQEVFLKAWRGCKTLDLTDLNFSAWLYKVASNTVNDFYRKSYREPQTVWIDDEHTKQIAGDDDIVENLNQSMDKAQVHQTVKKLPTHFRQVIELRFLQDLSIAETAKILGKESVTIRVWQFRAVRQLQKLYEQFNQNNVN